MPGKDIGIIYPLTPLDVIHTWPMPCPGDGRYSGGEGETEQPSEKAKHDHDMQLLMKKNLVVRRFLADVTAVIIGRLRESECAYDCLLRAYVCEGTIGRYAARSSQI